MREPWLSPKCELRDLGPKGLGIVALEPIEAGETVVVWGGAYGDAAFAEAARAAGHRTMRWDVDWFSSDEGPDHPAFRINHSCDPNVWMEGPKALVARRGIAEGEEIAADYAMWCDEEGYVSAWACLCGAPICRGRVTGRDRWRPDLQREYAGHFSPWIEHLIAESQPSARADRKPGDGQG